MALVKELMLSNGVTVDYHRISEIRIKIDDMMAVVYVKNYLVKTTRTAGATHVEPIEQYVAKITDENKNAILQLAYPYLKYAVNEFADAKDDI